MGVPSFADRVLELSTSTGTEPYVLDGAIAGYVNFSAVGDGNSCFYCATAVDDNGAPTGDWEIGVGTYTSAGTTLSRDSVSASTNGGDLVNWAAGTKRVFVVAPAVFLNMAGVAATLTTDLGEPEAEVNWVADVVGKAGNSLQIEYVDPGSANQTLSASYDGELLTINLSTSPPVGGIATSSLSNAGSGWAASDTALVVAAEAPVMDVDQGEKIFTVSGLPGLPLLGSLFLVITGSTGNDGVYTVVSVSGDDVTGDEAIPDGTPDGDAFLGSATIEVDTVSTGAIATYTVTAPGLGYQVDDYPLVAMTGSGQDAILSVDTLASATYRLTTTSYDILALGGDFQAWDGFPATATVLLGNGYITALAPTHFAGGLDGLTAPGPSLFQNPLTVRSSASVEREISVTSVGTGWSHVIGSTYVHSGSETDPIGVTVSYGVTPGQTYLVTIVTTSGTTGSISVSLGGGSFQIDGDDGADTFTGSIIAADVSQMVVTPTSNYDGSIDFAECSVVLLPTNGRIVFDVPWADANAGAQFVLQPLADNEGNALLTLGDGVRLSVAGAFTFPDNVRQTFNPGSTNAGLNVGSHAGDPSAVSNGDVWYNSSANALKARVNGSTVSLGEGGGASLAQALKVASFRG